MAIEGNTGGGRRPISVLLLGLAAFCICISCTTIKETATGAARAVRDSSRVAVDAITPSGSGPKNRVVLIGVENRAEPALTGFATQFRRSLTEHLQKECRQVLVEEAAGEIIKSPPRLASGQVDGFSLAMMGRPRGVNFFVIGSLTDVRFQDEKSGFWWWKKTRYWIRATLRLEIIDSATGTKASDESLWETAIVDEMKYEAMKETGAIPLNEIAPILELLLREARQKTCEVLRSQPWRGFITSVDRNRLTLSAGSAVGLAPGSALEVFGKGRIVENRDGQRFLAPGEKIGEARVQSVTADQAEVVLDPSASAAGGGTVRLR
jgi:hypothetical protein